MSIPTVAHICPSYPPDTFIYQYLKAFREVKPIVLAGKLENNEHIRLTIPVYNCSHRRFTLRWLLDVLGGRLTGHYDLYRHFVLKASRASLIHAHHGPNGYEALRIKRSTSLPLITTFYGADMSVVPKVPGWMEKYAELFSEGDLFLVEGSHMMQKLVELGCPEGKVDIQHIAIDTEQFRFHARSPRGDGTINLLFCGRFTEKKGLMYALRAFSAVYQQFPGLRLRIIGDGEQRQQVEQFVRKNNLERAVEFLGYQSHAVVAYEMDQADIFIHPSVTAANGDTEGGAPTILLEAQASGIPVLTTWHADIPEVTLPGQSALLSKERDWEGLADNLFHFISKPDEWLSFGQAGRYHVEQNYNIRTEVIKLESKYLQLLSIFPS